MSTLPHLYYFGAGKIVVANRKNNRMKYQIALFVLFSVLCKTVPIMRRFYIECLFVTYVYGMKNFSIAVFHLMVQILSYCFVNYYQYKLLIF